MDVRAENDRSKPGVKYLRDRTNKISEMACKPAIFHLFKKLYGVNVPSTDEMNFSCDQGDLEC